MTFEMTVLLCIAAATGFLLVVLAVMYHKLSLAISKLRPHMDIDADNVFSQLEALLALQIELKLEHALPPTRGWAASPDFLRNVMIHARTARPGTIVECSSGISTVVLARCVQINETGHVFSLEHEPEFAQKTRQMLKQQGLEAFATVLDAPLTRLKLPGWEGLWYSSAVLPDDLCIDLLVIDGPPEQTGHLARYPAIPVLHQRLNPDAAVFLDDAGRSGEKEAAAKWQQAYADLTPLRTPACEKGCLALAKAGTDAENG